MPGAAPQTQPNPENLGRQLQQAASDTLTALWASSREDPGLRTFPVLFTILKGNQGMSPRLRLEIIATLSLMERPLLLIFLATPEPHI